MRILRKFLCTSYIFYDFFSIANSKLLILDICKLTFQAYMNAFIICEFTANASQMPLCYSNKRLATRLQIHKIILSNSKNLLRKHQKSQHSEYNHPPSKYSTSVTQIQQCVTIGITKRKSFAATSFATAGKFSSELQMSQLVGTIHEV